MLSRCRELWGYHMEVLIVDHIGLRVWKVSHFMYDIYIFTRFRKTVILLHLLQTLHTFLMAGKGHCPGCTTFPHFCLVFILCWTCSCSEYGCNICLWAPSHPRFIKKTSIDMLFELSCYLSLFLDNKCLLLTCIDMYFYVILSTLRAHWPHRLTMETL